MKIENSIIKRHTIPDNIELPDTFHPVIKRVLAARQIKTVNELEYGLQNLLPYTTLLGIEDAVTLLYEALANQARILIIADYDADGATSCVLAIKALQQMGAKKINFLVPNREKQGYGLTPELIEVALEDSFLRDTPPSTDSPDLLITVDNGISSFSGVSAAKECGMRVLVTDHHLPRENLPDADAIINPKQEGDLFPSKNLCGVGVIFYVMMALRARLREKDWFKTQNISEPNMADFLDLVALGTITDVVPLDYNNRILIEQGLRRIRANRCSPGIGALVQMAKREQTRLIASDLAFYVGPYLNAAGRMDDMSYGIRCLLSEDYFEAKEQARLLKTFNEERRFEEAKMQKEALDMLNTLGDPDTLPIGLCLLDEKWHQGVIGILAARIKDRLHRPVIIFTHDKENYIRGSGRSVQGVHLHDIIERLSSQHPDMITYFGGHAMAAGLTIPQKQFDAFQDVFDKEVRQHLGRNELHGMIYSDGALSEDEFSLKLAEQLRMLTPWGHHFPEPVFDGEFEVLDRRILKEKHLKMWVRPLEGGTQVEAIAFNTVDTDWPSKVNRVQLAYKLDVNSFRGTKNVQLMAKSVIVID
ncbi:MAG: single-stranded-DNA-specific exonuclease RecJ [Thiomargarita sp.]|nr:single-stranded-DNA-specific exonuclease RecJ [Thiomargarita sp.]